MASLPYRKIIFLIIASLLVGSFSVSAQVTENVSVNATVGEDVEVSPGGGGGFGFFTTGVRFSGQAYPNAKVTLLKEGTEMLFTYANSAGNFSVSLREDYDAKIIYSIFAEDVLGNRSLLINYPLVVQVGYITHLSGIRFPPTIVTDKAEAKSGSFLTVSGYALPSRALEVSINGAATKNFSLTSSTSGTYKIVLPLSGLPKGEYNLSIKYKTDVRISKLVKFSIGELDIFHPETLRNIPGDCNSDTVINLVDFSVLAFWYGRPNPPVCVDTNRDGTINLTDFSILAFYWTG